MTAFTRHTLYARDPLRAASFYRDLFGWTVDDEGRCTREGHLVASIERSHAPPHVPSYWLPFLAVEKLDAAVEQARALGARVRRHTEGLEALLIDPRNALVGLCSGGERSDAFAWDELLTDDLNAATEFYVALGDFTFDTIDRGAAGPYHVLRRNMSRVGGVMKHPAGLHPHWQPYFAVTDVDAMTETAVGLGATSCFAPMDILGFGRISAVDDPVGAGICFLRPALSAAQS